MSKQAAPRRVGDKEALAVATQIRGSAQKLNLVAGLIRGKKADEALNILSFSTKAMAVDARKVLANGTGALVAPRGLLGQCGQDHRVQVRADSGVAAGGRLGRRLF